MQFPQRLLDGYRAFRETRLPVEQHQYRRLAEVGQRPEIMVIGCCDSRVSPEVIFDAHPGELFVLRNIANLVPPFTPTGSTHGVSSAIEFAVQALAVKHIVVLAHGQCGGIRAFVTQEVPLSAGDFIGKWMGLISPAADKLGERGDEPLEDYLTKLEQAATVTTLDNLMTFPFVRRRVEAGELHLHAAYFGVATGEMQVRDPVTGVFAPVGTGPGEPRRPGLG